MGFIPSKCSPQYPSPFPIKVKVDIEGSLLFRSDQVYVVIGKIKLKIDTWNEMKIRETDTINIICMLLHNHNLEILLITLQWDDIIPECKKASYIHLFLDSLNKSPLLEYSDNSQSKHLQQDCNDNDSSCYSSSFHNLNINFYFMVRFFGSDRSPKKDNLFHMFVC